MIKLFYKYALIALVISISACAQTETKPSPFFDRKQMGDIITDVHLAEAKVNALVLSGDTLNKTMLAHYDFIYKKHNITEKAFKDNYNYYLENPVLLDSVYADVLVNCAQMQLAK
ncbi:MAG: DUF4296 domain-containing protein [Bacteroidota bacterium]